MIFTPQQFAQAFISAFLDTKVEERENVIARTADVLKRSGKSKRIPQIISAIESVWHAKTGANKVMLHSALPLSTESVQMMKVALGLKDQDVLEARVDPTLVAGVVINENDNRILDLSFRSRVNNLFAR